MASAPPAPTPVIVEEPEPPKPLTIEEKIEHWAGVYKVSYDQMYRTLYCESGLKQNAVNLNDPYGGAYGIAQFLKPTFNAYSVEAGIENPDITNVDHQLETMAYMFSIGENRQWTCWRMLYL